MTGLETIFCRCARVDSINCSSRHDFNSTLPKRVLSEAASFEKRLVEDKAVIWPLVADDGDMLVLAHLFSDSLVRSDTAVQRSVSNPLTGCMFPPFQVELELDTTSTLEARPYTDYKTRKTGEARSSFALFDSRVAD